MRIFIIIPTNELVSFFFSFINNIDIDITNKENCALKFTSIDEASFMELIFKKVKIKKKKSSFFFNFALFFSGTHKFFPEF